MTEDQLQRCKQSLLKLDRQHKDLEQELKLEQKKAHEKAFVKSGNSVTSDKAPEVRNSRIDAMQEQHTALEASRRNEMHAEEIEGGLRRIESGDYGICFYCEEEIAYSRLEENPTHTRCLKCAD